MQVVAVGVDVACEHFTDNDSGKAATDAFHTLHRACLEAYRREQFGKFFRSQVEVHVFFKPFI